MGYACPVCGDPQSDAGHLANHLAFTAVLRGGDHEEWLAEHVPEWGGMDEAALAERVAEDAEETEFPQVFEDTTDQGHEDGHGHHEDGHRHDHAHAGGRASGVDGRPGATAGPDGGFSDAGDLPAGADALGDPGLDEAAREALAEAREMTRKRRENARDAESKDSEDAPDGDEENDGENGETEASTGGTDSDASTDVDTDPRAGTETE